MFNFVFSLLFFPTLPFFFILIFFPTPFLPSFKLTPPPFPFLFLHFFFFILFFPQHTYPSHNSQYLQKNKKVSSHKSHHFSFFPPQFSPPHIHTPSPHHTFHTYPLFFLVSLSIPLFFPSTVHIFTGFVQSSLIFFLNLLLFPTHVHKPKFSAGFLFFFLRCR